MILDVRLCRDCRYAITTNGHIVCNLLNRDIDYNDFCSFSCPVLDDFYLDDNIILDDKSNIKYFVFSYKIPNSKNNKAAHYIYQRGFMDVNSFVDFWQSNVNIIVPLYLKVVYDNKKERIYHDIDSLRLKYGIHNFDK